MARTDRIKDAPFYKSYRKTPETSGAIVVLPVRTDSRNASRLEELRAAVNDYIRSQKCCRPVDATLPANGAPDLYVGSSEGENAPLEARYVREDHEKYPPMIIHYAKPGAPWRSALRTLAADEGARRVIAVQLDLVQYPKADKGLFGKKVVLGTHHEEKVRVLSAIDKPIEVLQLSGVALDADGNELCAGAEGIVGSDAPFWVQVLEAGKDIDDDMLEHVLKNERRDDIPGAPLNWQAAADQLLWNLSRR